VNVDAYEITFELSEPFRPVEQLLAVLPADSVKALPECCQWLMLDRSSPLKDIYSSDIPIDPNGKVLPWLWVVLLPFIDERRITAAMELCDSKMSLEEKRRNSAGTPLMFLHLQHGLASLALSQIDYGSVGMPEYVSFDTASVPPQISPQITPDSSVRTEFTFSPEEGAGISGSLSMGWSRRPLALYEPSQT
jgi:5'-3' exonuclease